MKNKFLSEILIGILLIIVGFNGYYFFGGFHILTIVLGIIIVLVSICFKITRYNERQVKKLGYKFFAGVFGFKTKLKKKE